MRRGAYATVHSSSSLRCPCGSSSRQAVDRFLFGHAGVPSNPLPADTVSFTGCNQLLPKSLIPDRRTIARSPMAGLPEQEQVGHSGD